MQFKGQRDTLGVKAPFLLFASIAGAAALAVATSWAHEAPNQRRTTSGLGQLKIHLAPSVYWPLTMGNKWTFGRSGTEVPVETHLAVTRLSMGRGGEITASLDTDSFAWTLKTDKGVPKTEKSPTWDPWTSPVVVKVDDTGIYWISDQHGTFNPPVPIFKAGTKHGDEWKWAGTVEKGRASWSASATLMSKSTKVKTPRLAVKEHDALEIMMILNVVVGGEAQTDLQSLSLVPKIGPVTFGYVRYGSGQTSVAQGGGTLIDYQVRN